MPRRLYILSDAGKPIWTSTNEPESRLAQLTGVVTAVLGFAAMQQDQLRLVRAGGTSVVVLVRGAVVLLAASPHGEAEAFLALLLEALYHQLLFTLTAAVQRTLARSGGGYDLRGLLGAHDEGLLAALARRAGAGGYQGATERGGGGGGNGNGADAGLLCGGAVRSLPLHPATRAECGRVLAVARRRLPVAGGASLLFAVLLCGDRLVTLLQPRSQTHSAAAGAAGAGGGSAAGDNAPRGLHPADLGRLALFVQGQKAALRGTESWTPLCLPRFDARGYLYAYIGFLDAEDQSDVALVLVSSGADAETFFALQGCRRAVGGALARDGALAALLAARDTLFSGNGGGGGSGVEERFLGAAPTEAAAFSSPAPALRSPWSPRSPPPPPTPPPPPRSPPPRPRASPSVPAKARATAAVAAGSFAEAAAVRPLHFVYVYRPAPPAPPAAARLLARAADVAAAALDGVAQAPPQYLCPSSLGFPLDVSEAAAMRGWTAYQRSFLRLRHGSAAVETTLPPPPTCLETAGAAGAAASAVWECAPAHAECYEVGPHEVCAGLAGAGFECHALFSCGGTTPEAARAALAALVARVRRDAPRLFSVDTPAY